MARLMNRETYKIMSYMKNYAINVKGGAAGNGCPVIGYGFEGSDNEKWIVVYEGEDSSYFSLTSRAQGKGGVRYVLDASQKHATKVVVHTYNRLDQQLWCREPIKGDKRDYLCYIKNKKTGNYLQYNGPKAEISVVPKVDDEKQWWSFQELDTQVCADGLWLDSLKDPVAETRKKEAEKKIMEEQRIELERREHEIIERERIERQRIEKERTERERIERAEREAEIAAKEKEIAERDKRIAELKKSQIQKDKDELELTAKEQELAERERQLKLKETEIEEKAKKERELWLKEREKTERELQEVLHARDEKTESLRRAKEENDRFELQLREKERLKQQQLNDRKAAIVKREAELRELERTDRAEYLRQREIWLKQLEEWHIKITVITHPNDGSGIHGHTHTTTTHTVEHVGDEKITTKVTVTEHETKTVEYN